MDKSHNKVSVLLNNRSNQLVELLVVASLAKKLEVTLQGVYLEEEDLLCAAELSISRDISSWSGKEKEISSDTVKNAFRAHAINKKQELKLIAKQEHIEYEFNVVRGERNAWILDEIKRNSLLYITDQNSSINHVNRINQDHFKYSFLQKKGAVGDPVKVIFSGSSASIKALEIAIQIALLSHRSLKVLMVCNSFEDEMRLREQLNSFLHVYLDKHKSISVNAEPINTQSLAKSLFQQLYMLIYPVENNDLQHLPQLLHNLHCPLVLVR